MLILSIRIVPGAFQLRKRRKLLGLTLDFDHLDTLHYKYVWFLFSHNPFGWLPTIMADLNLMASVLSFTIKPIILGTCQGKKKSHYDF